MTGQVPTVPIALPDTNGSEGERIVSIVKSDPVTEIDLTGDHLNAERFLSEHGDKVKWSPEMGQWFVWNGTWWEQDSLELAQELAKETIDGLRSWVGEAKDKDQFKRVAALLRLDPIGSPGRTARDTREPTVRWSSP